MRKYFKKREEEKKAALQRIKMLFALAKQEFPKHPDRAHRYARMINDLIKKVRVRPPKSIRMFICKECNHFLYPGKNLKVKSMKGFMIYECLNCGNIKKYGYTKEKRK
jgi:ribonuclease P protein subunit RPR2